MEDLNEIFYETLEGEKLNYQFESGKTYAVRGILSLSQNLIIPEDVTLIFQGGKFKVAEDYTEQIEIKGFNTRLEAPICTIFGIGINVTGSWDIDRAYPQWFDLGNQIYYTAYDEENNPVTDSFYDWSASINKAIKMKQIGEVFLKNGDYSIASPIIMNCQIQLVGENSQYKDVKDVLNSENKIERKIVGGGSTRIFPVAEGTSTYSDEYMLYVNVETETKSTFPGMEYIVRSTLIKNICFSNWIKKSSEEKLKQKCILAGGGVHLDNLVWYNFLQAVKYTDTYNDGRCIRSCIFSTDPQMCDEADKDVYAFDTGFLGDGMFFELNGIAVTANGKALRLSNCGGASIQGNVINGDILIESSKAVVFNANHCENGMQIEIVDSCVTTNNNFFEKGTRPNIFIHNSDYGDKSVISMNNDMFMMYNFPRFNIDINKTAEDIFELFQNQINNISESDIRIDKNTILNINNVYRYEFGEGLFGKMYPFGIKIEKNEYPRIDLSGNTTYHPFEEFNKYSYIASCNSKILSGYKLNIQATINDINAPRLNCSQTNGGVKWFEKDGTYRYYYQILWDRDRGLMKTSSSTNTSESINTINWYPEQVNMSNDVEKITDENSEQISFTFSPGVLLDMSEETNGNCAMIRLIRYKNVIEGLLYKSSYDYVDVPVCGSRYLYDNGISVCGYKWKFLKAGELPPEESCDNNIEMLRIIDGNVERQ